MNQPGLYEPNCSCGIPEALVYVKTVAVGCSRCGKKMTFVRGLTDEEREEGGNVDENREPSKGVRMPRGKRTPEPDEKEAAAALKLLQGGKTRKAVVEATGLTDYQVWRIMRDNDLLKHRT